MPRAAGLGHLEQDLYSARKAIWQGALAGLVGVNLTRNAYRFLAASGAADLYWRLSRERLRILCYHGVCQDSIRAANWVPDCFVSLSAFEDQMRHLSSNARVLPLMEAMSRLRAGTLPPRSVCITFDDGYANNLQLAYPVLAKYGLPATIFLSSAYLESGEFFPFIRLKLIRLRLGKSTLPGLLDYKSDPLDLVLESAGRWWKDIESGITEDQREALRPLCITETSAFDPELIELGGHGHTHCVLGNESDARRRFEITACIQKIAQWTGRPVRVFAYPNGQRGDFGALDKEVLRTHGVSVAVTGIGGANRASVDPLELKRYPVGLHHDLDGFRAELSGLRSAILRINRKYNEN
jgi:peptidoglycan/xylan/chitin deacetylase (PgdA/CDA1 family)